MFLCLEKRALKSYIFYVAKFVILTPLSLLSWCRLSFPIVGLKIFSLPAFVLKSPNRIVVWYLRKCQNPVLNPQKKYLFSSSSFSSLCKHIQNTDITPHISQNYIQYPITEEIYSLKCWYYPVVYTKYLLQIDVFSFPFHRQKYNSVF